MTKVCRLCLQKLTRGAKYFNINAVESFTGFMPYRDQLTTCIPEMALDLIPNPVVCNSCRTALKYAYDFKSRCLLVEKKIRSYIEQLPENTVIYDLSQIRIDDLPPINKMHILQNEFEHDDEGVDNREEPANCELLMQLQKETNFSITGEVEITNVTKRKKMRMKESAHYCFKCWKKFDDIQELLAHKANHSEDFVCNFCNQPFKSLQYLRRHNSVCSKDTGKIQKNTILTKRPHLPTKAKNHLKRWLFKHTEHPYPTDVEKQTLMQETNLSLLQVENWFINARRRILQDLTKLKQHGLTCEDVSDNTLGLQLDIEEMFTEQIDKKYKDILSSQNSITLTTPNLPIIRRRRRPRKRIEDVQDVEEVIEATSILKTDLSIVKPDPDIDIEEDPLDIKIDKTETVKDR